MAIIFYSKVTHWLIILLWRCFFLQKFSPIFKDHCILFEYFGGLARNRRDRSLQKVSTKHSPSEDNAVIMLQLRAIVRLYKMDDSIIGLHLQILLDER